MANLLVVEDATIRSMLADPRVTELLPCLQQTKKTLAKIAAPGCAMCHRKKSQESLAAMVAAKSCIAGLRGEQLNSLKKLLRVKRLRVVVSRGNRRVQHTL